MRHIRVFCTIIPHRDRWLIAVAIDGLKKIAKLSLRSSQAQLTDKVEKATTHERCSVDCCLHRGHILARLEGRQSAARMADRLDGRLTQNRIEALGDIRPCVSVEIFAFNRLARHDLCKERCHAGDVIADEPAR